ncbi:MAG: M13 family metallopeptidase [Pseudomonadota bacterium]
MHKSLSLMVIAGLAAACSQEPSAETTAGPDASETAQPAAKAELGDWGFDLAARDTSVDPGDDFFQYAGGAWIRETEIPSDKSRYGAFNVLIDRVDERIRALIEEIADGDHADGSLEQKIADYYNSYMDTEAIEAAGLDPLAEELAAIAAIETREDLLTALARTRFSGSRSPFGLGVGVDRKNPDRYLVGLGVGGLGLPDRDYYLVDSDRFTNIRVAYEAHIADMLSLAEIDGAAEKASAILALETRIAEHHWPRADRRDRDKTYNPYTVGALAEEFSNFDWPRYIEESGYGDIEDLNVSQPSSLAPIAGVIRETPIETWRAYLSYHLLANHAAFLPRAFDEEAFEFYGKTLRGQPEQQPRWKRGVQQVAGRGNTLGEAMGRIYVDKYFPPEAKAQMDDLVENLRDALRARIENLDWMGEATKEEAYAKLSTFDPRIGYPDKWKDYSALDLEEGDLIGNVRRVREFYFNRSRDRLDQPTDKIEWRRNTPQTVNASYNSQFNQITFPAGILQPPFFDPNADPAVNYGAIGAVIGHEMGHGFDDQGSKSDANGVQRNWWTDEDRARFEERANKLADQYDAYQPVPDNFVDGRFTLGENIGDLGGLSMAYYAYKLSLKGEEAPVLDGLTGDQRFFLAWAQVWRSKIREQALLAQLKSDPHAPARYRVNGVVRNMDAWYEAFEVAPGDDLYLTPEDRVSIW